MTIPYSKPQPPPINQLPNVNISETLLDGEVLKYNATTEEWINGSAGSSAGTEVVDTENLRSLTTNTGTNLTSAAANNILLGQNVGQGLTTQDNNIQLGHNINEVNEGVRNILIGRDLGRSTTGGYNIVLGSNMGNSASNGILANRNIMIGNNIGGGRIVGQWNVLIGEDVNTGSNGISLINNVMIGRQAGVNCRSSENTFVGYTAGQNNINGSNNTSLGRGSGNQNNSNQTVNIGMNAGRVRPTGEDNAVCIGSESGNFGSGQYSVQLGYRANYNTPANYKRVIVINATGVALESTQSDTCKIAPIRPIAHNLGAGMLYYDTTTSELSVSSTDITKFHAEFNTDPTDITTSGATIVFDTTTYNINGGYNTGTGLFTAPTNGFYHFECFFRLSNGGSFALNWEVNGVFNKTEEQYNSGTAYMTYTTSWTGILGAGDTIELSVFFLVGTLRFSKAQKNGLTGYYIGK